MQSEAEKLLSEIENALRKRLQERAREVKHIVANLAVSEEEYVQLMVEEVIDNTYVDAHFAFPPRALYTPEELKKRALALLQKKLERDMRLFKNMP